MFTTVGAIDTQPVQPMPMPYAEGLHGRAIWARFFDCGAECRTPQQGEGDECKAHH